MCVCVCEQGVIPESSVSSSKLSDNPVQLGVDGTAHALHHSLHACESLVDNLAREHMRNEIPHTHTHTQYLETVQSGLIVVSDVL